MSKPWIHSVSSAKKFGGLPSEYMPIHNFLDSSKQCLADMRHRAILHSSFGIFITEKVFGETAINSDGKVYSIRDVAEQHVLEDMGFIPSVQDYLCEMPMYEWLGGGKGAEAKRKAFEFRGNGNGNGNGVSKPGSLSIEELEKIKENLEKVKEANIMSGLRGDDMDPRQDRFSNVFVDGSR